MGEVVNITAARGGDIHALIAQACNQVPISLDQRVLCRAHRVAGERLTRHGGSGFGRACLIVCMLCALTVAAVLVWMAQMRPNESYANPSPLTVIDPNANLAQANSIAQTVTLAPWRNSRDSWLEHIAKLQQHPQVKALAHERRLLQETFGQATQ